MTLATNGLNTGTKVYTWTYADATSRAAATGFAAGDTGSLALQLDDGSLWRLTATTPTWQAVGGGLANPMTTAGDLIYGGASGTPTRLAQGGNNTVLGVDGSGTFGYKADPSGGGGAVTQIATGDLAAAAATIAFSAIPGTYRDLLLVLMGRTTSANQQDTVLLQCNGDTGANYDWQTGLFLGTSSATAQGLAATAAQVGELAGGGVAAGIAATVMIELPAYAATTFHKQFMSRGYQRDSVSELNRNRMNAGDWRSTAAITALTLTLTAGSFAAGTRCALYGRQ